MLAESNLIWRNAFIFSWNIAESYSVRPGTCIKNVNGVYFYLYYGNGTKIVLTVNVVSFQDRCMIVSKNVALAAEMLTTSITLVSVRDREGTLLNNDWHTISVTPVNFFRQACAPRCKCAIYFHWFLGETLAGSSSHCHWFGRHLSSEISADLQAMCCEGRDIIGLRNVSSIQSRMEKVGFWEQVGSEECFILKHIGQGYYRGFFYISLNFSFM